MPSIISKLWREKGMKLSRMQDIGGLRAVVSNLKDVYALEKEYRSSRFQHELVTNQCKDYIASPKTSGYRSIHLIYRYKNARAPEYDGLLLELQLRTKLQHAWATAVETMGTFLNHPLKASEGPEEWLNFFSLAGSAFAHLEKTSPVPGYEHLTKEETFSAVVKKILALDVKNKLHAFTVAADRVITDKKGGSYHLILLDTFNKNVTIKSFSQSNLEQASKEYSEAELRISNGELLQAVLVSAGSIDNLRKAYPNYFLDTHEFVLQLNRIEKSITSGGSRQAAAP
jgi:Region found in RelA / SpoT proteins